MDHRPWSHPPSSVAGHVAAAGPYSHLPPRPPPHPLCLHRHLGRRWLLASWVIQASFLRGLGQWLQPSIDFHHRTRISCSRGLPAFQTGSASSPPWGNHRFPPEGTGHSSRTVTPLCLLILWHEDPKVAWVNGLLVCPWWEPSSLGNLNI